MKKLRILLTILIFGFPYQTTSAQSIAAGEFWDMDQNWRPASRFGTFKFQQDYSNAYGVSLQVFPGDGRGKIIWATPWYRDSTWTCMTWYKYNWEGVYEYFGDYCWHLPSRTKTYLNGVARIRYQWQNGWRKWNQNWRNVRLYSSGVPAMVSALFPGGSGCDGVEVAGVCQGGGVTW